MSLRFDHCYTIDSSHRFRTKLGRAGFKLENRVVEHPGKRFCRFIMLPETSKAGRQYLEFVHTGKGGDRSDSTPGISLGALTPLIALEKRLKKKRVDAKFVHKNYEWKTNSTDRLPGWNFITFPKHKSAVFTWLTEYEKSKKRKIKSTKNLKHPNQVYRFVSIEVEMGKTDFKLYTQLLGASKDSFFKLKCGTSIRVSRARKSKIKTVVLATKDLGRMIRNFQWDELTVYDGLPAVRITNPDSRMWDVVIVQM